MPKQRTARVTLHEAYEAPSYGQSVFRGTIIKSLLCGGEPHDIVFSSLDELKAIVKTLADDYTQRRGYGCAAFVRLPRGERKPPGFDAATRNLYYNLTPEPQPEPIAAPEPPPPPKPPRPKAEKRLSCAETAKLLRAHLKREFPGTTFSIRSSVYSGGSSIHVRWTGGPTRNEVDAIAHNYSYAGFDGMIDLAYSYDTYQLPDGTLLRGGTRGTQGSMGVVPEYDITPPEGAIPVHSGASYVFCSREAA